MILITGEGRSGTTMMVEIFGLLGFDYGGHLEFLREVRINKDTKFPEVIKHGGFSANLKKWIDEYHWKVDHFFYMANDIPNAIAKRLHYPSDSPIELKELDGTYRPAKVSPKMLNITGKEWDILTDDEKESILLKWLFERLGSAAYVAIQCEVPFSVVHYQKFCLDVNYACSIMEPLLRLNRFTIERFRQVHKEHINLKLIKPWSELSVR